MTDADRHAETYQAGLMLLDRIGSVRDTDYEELKLARLGRAAIRRQTPSDQEAEALAEYVHSDLDAVATRLGV